MKQYLMSSIVALVVIATAFVAFGQQSERRQPRSQFRQNFLQRQTSAVETILEQAGKLKISLDEMFKFGESLVQATSKEEGAKFREEWGKRSAEWQKTREVIEQQLWKLTPTSQLRAKHNESIAELQFIHEQAVEEKAEKTAKHLEELIAKRNKEFGDTMQKLGFPAGRRRR